MNSKHFLVAAALAVMAGSALAQPETQVEVKKAPGQVTMSGTARVTATVVAIEAATRTVSLKDKKGKVVSLVVGEDARNFDQLKVGDVVTAEYKEAITLTLKKQGGGKSALSEHESMDRSAPGAKPGGTAGREVTILADVVAVNAKTKMVTLRGPKGNTLDLMVEDPEQMKNIKKGDQVQAVYTEAVAVSVEPAAGK
ncbi:hypothetical protein [Cupriavidus basilensis]|uniref:hypothetical protein n=1 Tax=Cupriavidus basilensis TaxID=68895 RepID=UPI00157AAB55|nr:hypothetical protein [Cupriavidus basilensis]NUA26617.1 hypothetical protein [Cupriavidus basilensis]